MLNTIAQALKETADLLAGLPETDPRLEAEVLLAHVLGKSRSYLVAWPERYLNEAQLDHFRGLAARRLNGEPVAYLTGHREFWSLDLTVTPAVLVPRPDTELLVERALHRIPAGCPWLLADLGTGSGAIAAALAKERPDCRITATDASIEALAVAESNFKQLELDRIATAHGRWCAALPPGSRFNLIVSNPPYVAEGDPALETGDLSWEPQYALRSGADGLDDIRRIIREAPAHLTAGGWLLLEHGFEQGTAVRRLLTKGGFGHIATHRDLAGHERVSEGRL